MISTGSYEMSRTGCVAREGEALSPAMHFLASLWRERNAASKPGTHEVWQGMRTALHLAIRFGLSFAVDDFVWMTTNTHGSYYDVSPFQHAYWFGTDNDKNFGEQFYCTAVQAKNISACLAFERWRKRQPFFMRGKRLHLGSPFLWKEYQLFVTSFDDPARALTACAYETVKQYDWAGVTLRGDGKITKRFFITNKEMKTTQKVGKAAIQQEND